MTRLGDRAPTERTVIITGGGTAGHVLPAIAVGEALVEKGWDRQLVQFVGARRGMEANLVPEAGFPIRLLPGRGIARRLTIANGGAVVGLAAAFVAALGLLGRRRPAAVVTVGGYAGVACSLAAVLLRVPIVVVNVDAVPGAANRLVARFAACSAVALPGTPLRRAVVTGAPVRPEVTAVDRTPSGQARAREALALPTDRMLVVVTGGSLGARRLNEAGVGLARHFSDRGDLTIYHVTGSRDLAYVEEAWAALETRGPVDYRLVDYEPRLPELFAAADVVVCRAGASTIAELMVIGPPSILVPLPNAPSDHQRRNAERLAERGAALLVDDASATSNVLALLIEELLDDPARRITMSEAARQLGRPDAASQVASLVAEVADPRTRGRRPSGATT